eukprot:SAG11_NODE_1477_length_4837_cov_2.462431_5_plen_226_part_00
MIWRPQGLQGVRLLSTARITCASHAPRLWVTVPALPWLRILARTRSRRAASAAVRLIVPPSELAQQRVTQPLSRPLASCCGCAGVVFTESQVIVAQLSGLPTEPLDADGSPPLYSWHIHEFAVPSAAPGDLSATEGAEDTGNPNIATAAACEATGGHFDPGGLGLGASSAIGELTLRHGPLSMDSSVSRRMLLNARRMQEVKLAPSLRRQPVAVCCIYSPPASHT